MAHTAARQGVDFLRQRRWAVNEGDGQGRTVRAGTGGVSVTPFTPQLGQAEPFLVPICSLDLGWTFGIAG